MAPKANKKAATKPKTAADWAKEYGTQVAIVNSDAGLKDLFNKAVAEKWTGPKFQAEFQNSTWYKTHADTWRVAEAARLTDPASWKEQLANATTLVRQQANDLGFQLDDTQAANLAKNALYLAGGTAASIDNNMLKTHVVEVGKITGQGGTALSTMDALKQAAFRNGVQYNDAWYQTAAKDIVAGTGNIQKWNKQITDTAKSRYPVLASQLDAGMTVMDVASPYMQQMAATFEVDPNAIKLDDPTIQKALTNLNKDSQPELKPLWQFSRELKQDDRYFKTNQAHQDMAGMATEIARQFGRAS
mgnify:CR=1 FL=1